MTKIILVLHKILGTKEVITDLLSYAKNKNDFTRIIDIGAGSGGITPEVIQNFNTEYPSSYVELTPQSRGFFLYYWGQLDMLKLYVYLIFKEK